MRFGLEDRCESHTRHYTDCLKAMSSKYKIPEIGFRWGSRVVAGYCMNGFRQLCVKTICDCGNAQHVVVSKLYVSSKLRCNKCPKTWRTTHGHSKRSGESREYRAWLAMKQRCQPDFIGSKYYFEKGIKVCDIWLDSFEVFFKDVGPAPGLEYMLERIDNKKDYELGNVTWATRTEQNRNKSNNRYYEYNGLNMTLRAWEIHLGFNEGVLKSRLRLGWSLEKTLATPQKFMPQKSKAQ